MNTISGEAWFNQLHRALDVLSVQHRVIANNLANVNTPAYTKLSVDFRQELERQLQTGGEVKLEATRTVSNAFPLAGGEPPEIAVLPDTTGTVRPDGNNVNLEREMVDLAQANQLYAALTKIAAKNIQMTRYVITGGK